MRLSTKSLKNMQNKHLRQPDNDLSGCHYIEYQMYLEIKRTALFTGLCNYYLPDMLCRLKALLQVQPRNNSVPIYQKILKNKPLLT